MGLGWKELLVILVIVLLIFGTKRLIPAGAVTSVDDTSRCVHVDLSKEQVREAPEWETHTSAAWKDRYNDYYGPLGS